MGRPRASFHVWLRGRAWVRLQARLICHLRVREISELRAHMFPTLRILRTSKNMRNATTFGFAFAISDFEPFEGRRACGLAISRIRKRGVLSLWRTGGLIRGAFGLSARSLSDFSNFANSGITRLRMFEMRGSATYVAFEDFRGRCEFSRRCSFRFAEFANYANVWILLSFAFLRLSIHQFRICEFTISRISAHLP